MVRKVLIGSLVLPLSVSLSIIGAAGPAASAQAPTCDGRAATIVGTPGNDRLTGTRGPDVIVGRGGNDRIRGLGGDDVVCGGSGSDRLRGGRGDDRLLGGLDRHEDRGRFTVVTGDRLQGGPGDDHLDAGFQRLPRRAALQGRDTVSYGASPRGVVVDLRDGTATGEGSDTLVRTPLLALDGSRHDDVLRGSGRDDLIEGGRGDDDLHGRGGSDLLLDYAGDDVLDGGAAMDTLVSTAGIDTLDGGGGFDDILAASPRPNTVLGGPGFDYLSRSITGGEVGTIDGGEDGAQLELSANLRWDGTPSGVVDAEAGTAVLTAGDQTLTTTFSGIRAHTLGGPHWEFRGTEDDDFVQVLDGRLEADGRAGDDFFIGDRRNDVLDGGDGTDALWGAGGRNTCLNGELGECDGFPSSLQAVAGRRALTGALPRIVRDGSALLTTLPRGVASEVRRALR